MYHTNSRLKRTRQAEEPKLCIWNEWHQLKYFQPRVLPWSDWQAHELVKRNACPGSPKELSARVVAKRKSKVFLHVACWLGRKISRKLVLAAVSTVSTHHMQHSEGMAGSRRGQSITFHAVGGDQALLPATVLKLL